MIVSRFPPFPALKATKTQVWQLAAWHHRKTEAKEVVIEGDPSKKIEDN